MLSVCKGTHSPRDNDSLLSAFFTCVGSTVTQGCFGTTALETPALAIRRRLLESVISEPLETSSWLIKDLQFSSFVHNPCFQNDSNFLHEFLFEKCYGRVRNLIFWGLTHKFTLTAAVIS